MPPPPKVTGETDVQQIRAYLTAVHKSDKNPNVLEEDQEIPMRDGELITVRIYKPKVTPTGGSPVFVVYHGGGFCLGGLDTEALLCKRWTEHFGGIAINVDYRLAPEHVFPVAVNDAYDALKWVC